MKILIENNRCRGLYAFFTNQSSAFPPPTTLLDELSSILGDEEHLLELDSAAMLFLFMDFLDFFSPDDAPYKPGKVSVTVMHYPKTKRIEM